MAHVEGQCVRRAYAFASSQAWTRKLADPSGGSEPALSDEEEDDDDDDEEEEKET